MLLGALGAACGAPTDGPQHPGAAASASAPAESVSGSAAALSPSALALPPPPDPARRAIGTPRSVELPPTILPDPEGRAALLVHQDGIRRRSMVRRIDADGVVGPIQELDHGFVVASFDAPGPLLLSSDGTRLCVQSAGPAPARAHCRSVEAAAALAQPQGLWLLEQRQVVKRPAPQHPPRKKSAKHRRSGRKSGKGAAEKGPRARKSKATKSPVRLRLFVRSVDEDKGIAAHAEDSKLEFRQAMPGMGLVDAVDNKRGAQLLWYEHARSVTAGRKRIERARLRTGRLDPAGRFVRASRLTLVEAERSYGTLKGQLGPRLLGRDGAVVYAARFVRPKGKGTVTGFEAKRIRPWGAISAAPVVFEVDPFRLTAPKPISKAEVALLDGIWAHGPRLAAGQPRFELEHVAWVGLRGYFLKDGQLHSVARSDGSLRQEPPAFVARESRIESAAFAPDGEGLAQIPSGTVLLHPDGSLERLAALATTPAGDGAAGAPTELRPRRPVRIGASWWALRPRAGTGPAGYGARRLHPSAADLDWKGPPLHPDTAVLVGGAPRGMLVQWRAAERGRGRLGLWSLDSHGALRAVGELPSPLGPGLDAVARAGGGALVVGPSARRPGHLTVLAIDDAAAIQDRHELSWPAPAAGVSLHALPGGGGWLTDRQRTRVVWLGPNGLPRADLPWPSTDSGARCLDGRPTRHVVPGPEPGRFVTVPSFARAGSCISGGPSWAPDGSLRWFGSTVQGLDSSAEAGLVSPTSLGRPAPVPPATAAAAPGLGDAAAAPAPGRTSTSSARRSSPCPPDMVLVQDRTCVDRFEVHLVDAASGLPLSPDYPATPTLARITHRRWVRGRLLTGDLHARAMPLPPLLRPQGSEPEMVARSRLGARPSGYLTGLVAAAACQAAGKRLCKPAEWLTACRGEQDRKFPYGPTYRQGACNVFRHTHPAAVLHGNPSVGHLDPRLNRVTEAGLPLLRSTGATEGCASTWGDDRIFDMVGNLDEWVADKSGAFAGGFYARATRAGCDALITAHPRRYLDYSLGTRCCLDVKTWQGRQR